MTADEPEPRYLMMITDEDHERFAQVGKFISHDHTNGTIEIQYGEDDVDEMYDGRDAITKYAIGEQKSLRQLELENNVVMAYVTPEIMEEAAEELDEDDLEASGEELVDELMDLYNEDKISMEQLEEQSERYDLRENWF